MRYVWKRALSLFLALVLCLGFFPEAALAEEAGAISQEEPFDPVEEGMIRPAEEDETRIRPAEAEADENRETVASGSCGEDLSWTLDDEGTLTISGSGEMTNWTDAGEVPWNGQTVCAVVFRGGISSIGDYAFCGSNITSVTIPFSVTSLGNSAFQGCSGLEQIQFLGDAPSMEANVFQNDTAAVFYPAGNDTWTEAMRKNYGGRLTWIAADTAAVIAFGACGETLYWMLDENGLLLISGSGAMEDWTEETEVPWYAYRESIITAKILGGADRIGSFAFHCCTGLQEVTILDGAETIGEQAFAGCRSLEGVNLPDSVTSIGDSAFRNCVSLRYAGLPTSLRSIEDGAFEGCGALGAVSIPQGVTRIGDRAFSGCAALEKAILPDSLTEVGSEAFAGCGKLVTADLPDSVRSLGSGAFANCCMLSRQIIPAGLSRIQDSTFSNCRSLTSVTIPEAVTEIGEYAFHNCVSLRSADFPTSLRSIENGAFEGCGALGAVSIPQGVTRIGDRAFSGCAALENAILPDSLTEIGSEAFAGCGKLVTADLPDSVRSLGSGAFANCYTLSRQNIPAGISCIQDSTFSYCNSLASITVPETVKEIGKNAFQNCGGLSVVTLAPGVRSIGEEAFAQCVSLTALTLPSTLKTVDQRAFAGCSKLRSVTLPSSIDSFGKAAFENCEQIQTVFLDDLDWWLALPDYYDANLRLPHGDLYLNGALLEEITVPETVTKLREYVFFRCRSLRRVVLPAGLREIGNSAFGGCSSLTEVTIPEGVTTIGDEAFFDCSALSRLRLPSSVTSLGSSAFYGCTSLTEVNIPEGVTSIAGFLFAHCSSLTEITIPSGVTVIEACAFAGCDALEEVTLPSSIVSIGGGAFDYCDMIQSVRIDDMSWWLALPDPEGNSLPHGDLYLNGELQEEVTVPERILGLRPNMFRNWKSLKQVTLQEGLCDIGEGAFSGCSSLTEIRIPTSVESIGEIAFDDCSSLTEICIPTSVESIGVAAFRGCSSLKTVILPDTLTEIGVYVFLGCESLGEILLPEGLTAVEHGAFQDCRGLITLTIPASVNRIGEMAFGSCTGLDTVFFLGDAPDIHGNAFLSDWSAPMHVTLLYPADNETWTEEVLAGYGSWEGITWRGYRGEAKAYRVRYDANGGENAPADQFKGHGVDLTLREDELYRDDYSFRGWAEDPAATEAEYAPGESYGEDRELTLYAVWTGRIVQICFDPNNEGSDAAYERNKTIGEGLYLQDVPYWEGHVFLGWALNPDATEPDYPIYTSYMGDEPVTLYGVWQRFTFPVIYVVGQGAEGPASQTKVWNEDLVLSETVPVAEGYTFLGWSASSFSGIPDYQPGDTYTGNGGGNNDPIYFYAVWRANVYLVSYRSNGGEDDAPAPQIKIHGQPLTLSQEIPSREGYRFLGWSPNRWETEPSYQPGGCYTGNEDLVLYAIWEKQDPVLSTDSVLALSAATGYIDREFTVDLTLDKNPGVMMLSFRLVYDDSVLEFLGGTDGALTEWTIVPKRNRIAWDGEGDSTETGTLLRLKFRVKAEAQPGQTTIGFEDFFAGSSNGEVLEIQLKDAVVALHRRMAGDVNGDGRVNGFDLIQLRKYLAGMEAEFIDVNANVNGDDKVSILDLIRLRHYLAETGVILE